jgi:tetratricopeptide (TPR) repeat protein
MSMKRVIIMLLTVLAALMTAMTRVLAQDAELPRIMVVVDEKIDDKDVTAPKVAGRIESAFLAKGYRLVDRSQFESVRARDLALGDVNPTKAKELGRRFGAELIIAGGAQAVFGEERETYGIKTVEYTADGEIKVIITDTGDIIAVSSATSKKSSQGKSQAASKALDELGETLASDLLAKVEKKLKEAKEQPVVVQLALLGVNDVSLMKIEQDLPGRISMIQKMKLRYMEGDAAVLDVWIRGSIDDLRKQFSSMADYKVESFTGNRLDVNTKVSGTKAKVSYALPGSLEISEFKVENIFPAAYNYYAYNPIGQITIENTGKADVKNVKASFFIPTYMQLPSEKMIPLLKAGAKETFPVSVTLDSKQLLTINENTVAQIKAELSYNVGGEAKSRSLIKPVTVYSRTSITWSRPNSIGAFITSNDDAVNNFSRYVLGSVKYDRTILEGAPRNLLNAMAVWEGIRAFSINYVSAPWRVAEADLLDDVQFPRETLANHTANCSGSSVLLAACLENIGIQTALVGTSDHVFIIFDSGVNKKNASRVSVNDKDYVVKENTVWIPLETTIINHPFSEAWRLAADEYYKIADSKGRLDIIDVRAAWEQYPPADLAVNAKTAEPPPAEKVGALMNEDMKNISQISNQLLDKKIAELKKRGDEKSYNEASMYLANAGRYADAAAVLKGYTSPMAKNNLGNIYLMQGDSADAYKNYTAALEADKNDGGIDLNMGLLQYLGGDQEGTVNSFASAVSKFPSQEQAFTDLGIDHIVAEMNKTRGAEKGAAIDRNELQSLLFAALQDVAAKSTTRPNTARIRRGENKFVFGGRRGIDPTQLSNIKDFLYWKI